eukprot:gene52567-51043_t
MAAAIAAAAAGAAAGRSSAAARAAHPRAWRFLTAAHRRKTRATASS